MGAARGSVVRTPVVLFVHLAFGVTQEMPQAVGSRRAAAVISG